MGTPRTKSNIVLIGMRRSGKSSVGCRLAAALGRAFVDTDELVERRDGRPAGRILAESGEACLRRVEAAAVADAAAMTDCIIATGGGAVLDPGAVAALRSSGIVFYLYVAEDELIRRAAVDPMPAARPPLTGSSPDGEIRALQRERDPIYRQAADHVVDAAADPEIVTKSILAGVPAC